MVSLPFPPFTELMPSIDDFSNSLRVFRECLLRSWCRILRRRSQRHRITWQRRYALATQWLPPPHILHPYPAQRLRVMTQGKSPVR